MRAVLLTGHGGLEMLEYQDDYRVPEPAPDEVLVRVAACGMNNTDINTRVGWYAGGSWGGPMSFPRIQGADPVGRIVARGRDVAEGRIGERVLVDAWLRHPTGDAAKATYLGSERDGGYAEYVAVPASNAIAISSDLSDVELASFPCSYGTAEHMLHRAGVREGQWVVITGASGGVGTGLVQLAKRRGANVVAVTSAEKTSVVSNLGADVVLDRAAGKLADEVLEVTGGVDVLADVVGGEMFAPLLETVRHGGHYVVSGAVAGPVVFLDLRTVYLRDLTMHGATVLAPGVFTNLVGYVERGEIKPVVAGTFPLEELREAEESFLRRDHVGSIVIEVK
jgi:NADPH:quinone reductase-like Zn-dependent oxidoreductase